MSQQAVRSAEGEPWWPEFVAEYGKTPLRELARRFGTNPRRLRRAAQRSGLADEPEVIEENSERLGQHPDATLAEELGVTPEVIAGARRRRKLAAYIPQSAREQPPSEAASTEAPRPQSRERSANPNRQQQRWQERKARYRPDPDEVVVARRGISRGDGERPRRSLRSRTVELPPEPLDGAERGGRSSWDADGPRGLRSLRSREEDGPAARGGARPPFEDGGSDARLKRRRRRIVSAAAEEEVAPESPPEPPARARRSIPRGSPHGRVKISEPTPELLAELELAPEETPKRRAPRLPEPAPAPADEPAAATQTPDPAGGSLWQITLERNGSTYDRIVQAPDLVSAAQLVAGEGNIIRLAPAQTLK